MVAMRAKQPPKFVGDCTFCQKPIRGTKFASKIEGWTEHRRQGGANHILMSSAPLAYAHPACLKIEIATPVAFRQEVLI